METGGLDHYGKMITTAFDEFPAKRRVGLGLAWAGGHDP